MWIYKEALSCTIKDNNEQTTHIEIVGCGGLGGLKNKYNSPDWVAPMSRALQNGKMSEIFLAIESDLIGSLGWGDDISRGVDACKVRIPVVCRWYSKISSNSLKILSKPKA